MTDNINSHYHKCRLCGKIVNIQYESEDHILDYHGISEGKDITIYPKNFKILIKYFDSYAPVKNCENLK